MLKDIGSYVPCQLHEFSHIYLILSAPLQIISVKIALANYKMLHIILYKSMLSKLWSKCSIFIENKPTRHNHMCSKQCY